MYNTKNHSIHDIERKNNLKKIKKIFKLNKYNFICLMFFVNIFRFYKDFFNAKEKKIHTKNVIILTYKLEYKRSNLIV